MTPRWPVLAGALLGAGVALAACGGSAPPPTTGGPLSPQSSPATTSQPNPNPTPPQQPKVSISGKIAYSRAGAIWVFAGSSAEQLATVPGASDPAWSPDGSVLAFDKQDKNSADLYVMPYPNGVPKALGSNSNRVVENNLWEMQPDWAPDGLSLAFISDRGRLKNGTLDPAAWRLTLSNSARVQLTNANQYTGGVDFPRWRPGRPSDLLYTSWAYQPDTLTAYGQLMLQDTVSNQKQALTPAGQTSFQASWAPDGNNIAFIKREHGQDNVWITPVGTVAATISVATPTATASASTDAARLLVQGVAAHPTWAPDGHSIAYIGLKDGSFDLFVQHLDTQLGPSGPPMQLTSGMHLEAASSISWST